MIERNKIKNLKDVLKKKFVREFARDIVDEIDHTKELYNECYDQVEALFKQEGIDFGEDNENIENLTCEVREVIEDMKDEPDRCIMCAGLLDGCDYVSEQESRPAFWGAPCSETIDVGYRCSHCGHEEYW